MIKSANMTVEMTSESLPGRVVFFKVKLINHANVDYFFPKDHLAGRHQGGFSINNTKIQKRYPDVAWVECAYESNPHGKFDENIQFEHIPANGILEVKKNIVNYCGFLSEEPAGGNFYFKYDIWSHGNGGSILFSKEPSEEVDYIAGVTIPLIELPFELID